MSKHNTMDLSEKILLTIMQLLVGVVVQIDPI